jgi:rSAM/selenodomain-associated transferase 2
MISVVIPTFEAGPVLVPTLGALVNASVEGLVREVVIVDGGSRDATLTIIEDAGARLVSSAKGRGVQLAAGATEAKGPWLLFLHADTVLEAGWCAPVIGFINAPENRARAAVFRFALDDRSRRARALEFMVALRCRLFKLPYGDQGLLIHKDFYQQLGGFHPMPLMEDVDFARRIGGRNLHFMSERAVTSAARYRQEGYGRRSLRNLSCLAQYFAGVDLEQIAARYERREG